MHCTLLPIKDGKFAYKEIFAGKDKYEFSERMKQLHTDFMQKSIANGACPEAQVFPKRERSIAVQKNTVVCCQRNALQ